jgi:hypothetical protein
VIYCHEPFRRLYSEKLEVLVREMKSGATSQRKRNELIDELCKSHVGWRRPPFFPKDGLMWPSDFQAICWYLARIARRGDGLFCRLFSPRPTASFDLLIKEVDWARHLESTLRWLAPDAILILRHPCAVVSSLLRGQRRGLMPKEERSGWLHVHEEECRHLGYNPSSVLAMDECEFLALNWLIQNLTYQRVLESRPRTAIVVYEELCGDPLKITDSLFQFLGWSLGPKTREFIELSTGLRRSVLADWRRASNRYFGLYKDRTRVLEAWKTEMKPREKEEIIAIASLHPAYRTYWPESAPCRTTYNSPGGQWLKP